MRDFRQIDFLTSAAAMSQLPADNGREVAIAGRSNAGKSTAINAITGQKQLARVAKTPGRTQLLNFFEFHDGTRFVDLPGYGFAKVPLAVRDAWQALLSTYLQQRQSLAGVLLASDIRHADNPLDTEFRDWCVAAGVPVHILLTKCDKLSGGQAAARVRALQAVVASGVTVQAFSAVSGAGLDAARSQIAHWLDGSAPLRQ